jgi:EAL and modified HD-GYP domain-containing signal transduction protein
MQRVNITRQQILNTDQRLVGYRLIVRDSGASVDALVQALSGSSFLRTLGRRPVLMDVPSEVLDKEVADFLPAERSVLCLPPQGDDLSKRIKQQRRQGLQIALRCASPKECPANLLALANYAVTPDLQTQGVKEWTATLREAGVQPVAENLETERDFRAAQQAGFELFQGQFFARPLEMTADTLSPQQTGLVELFRDLAAPEPDFDAIEDIFRRNPELSYQLLKLVNSAAYRQASEVSSIRQAIVLLGKRQLQKWVVLLMASADGGSGADNPFMDEAILRGRLMELAVEAAGGDRDYSSRAFIVGALSVIHAQLRCPLNTLVQDLGLGPEIAGALRDHGGELGRLLDAAEKLRDRKEPPESLSLAGTTVGHDRLLELEEQVTLEG